MSSYVKSAPLPGVAGQPGSQCPASAQVGTATLTLGVDANGTTGAALPGKIYVVQSANPLQEVPTTLFTVFTTNHPSLCPASVPPAAPVPGCITAALSDTQIAPVTSGPDGDYRLRAVAEISARPDLSASVGQPANTVLGNIKGIQQKLWGTLPNGNAFQTNPTRCGDWKSTLYARSYGTAGVYGSETAISTASQTNTLQGTADPGGGDSSGSYAKFDAPVTTATNCENSPALTVTPSAALDNNARGANPGLSVTVDNPDSTNRDQAAKMVTTMPASISINVNALVNVCEQAQVVTDSCPAASQVGTAVITSPVLSQTQHGRVYMTRGATQGLPYLSIWVNGPNDTPAGAFKFRLDATTQFVGPGGNQIETTFDNLPPLPFDKFVVNITGGSSQSSLLLNRKCPGDGSTPADGPITFATTGNTGAKRDTSSATALAPCYGVSNPARRTHCVRVGRHFSVRPRDLVAKSTIARVELMVGTRANRTKRRATRRGGTFSFRLKLWSNRYRTNSRYHYGYRVVYKDGHVIRTKTATFRTCR